MEHFEAPPANAEHAQEIHERQIHGGALVGVMVALLLTLFMAALDQTVVDTAIPRIIGDLHGFDLYSWLITIYLLSSTTTIPIIGKLSDQFGRKWFVMGGVACFVGGSALAGLSQSMVQLIIFRAIQGLGAGALQALIFTLIADIFPPKERARWQGLFGGVFALASVVGPTIGGFITDNLSWRWVFYVNLPVGVLAFICLLLWLPLSISVRTTDIRGWATFQRVDIWGALTVAAATICLLLCLSWGGQTYPWASIQVIGLGAITILLFVLFFFIEIRVQEPILPLDLFSNRVFSVGSALSLAQGMAMFAVIVYMPLFIQGVLGHNATSSGAVITPLSIAMAITAGLAGFIISKIGRYQVVVIVGSIIMSIGVFLISRMEETASLTTVILNMVIMGAGLGTLLPVLNLAAQNALPQSRLGVGTGAVTFLRSMGATLATAILGTIVASIYNQHIADHLPPAAHALPAPLLKAVTDQQVLTNPAYRAAIIQQGNRAPGLAGLIAQIIGVVRDALYDGIHQAFFIAFFFCLAIVLLTLFLKDTPMEPSAQKPVPAKEKVALVTGTDADAQDQ